MSEKYEVRVIDGEYLCEVVDTETDVTEGFSSIEGAKQLCAKLNRLAALEKVCGELIRDGLQLGYSQSMDDYYDKGFDDASDKADEIIAQKLKAVLEEA